MGQHGNDPDLPERRHPSIPLGLALLESPSFSAWLAEELELLVELGLLLLQGPQLE